MFWRAAGELLVIIEAWATTFWTNETQSTHVLGGLLAVLYS